MDLYQFTASREDWNGSPPRVCIGHFSAVCGFIDREELKILFGGYVLYESDEGAEYIGVWGARNASRLRRMLGERGADFGLLSESPPGLRVKVRAVHHNPIERNSELK